LPGDPGMCRDARKIRRGRQSPDDVDGKPMGIAKPLPAMVFMRYGMAERMMDKSGRVGATRCGEARHGQDVHASG